MISEEELVDLTELAFGNKWCEDPRPRQHDSKLLLPTLLHTHWLRCL